MRLIKRFIVMLVASTMLTQFAACNAKETANNTASTVKDKAKNTVSVVKDKAVQAKDYVVDLYNQIDLTKFQNGWYSAVDFASSKYAAAMGSKYVTEVGNAINNLKSNINTSMGCSRYIIQICDK